MQSVGGKKNVAERIVETLRSASAPLTRVELGAVLGVSYNSVCAAVRMLEFGGAHRTLLSEKLVIGKPCAMEMVDGAAAVDPPAPPPPQPVRRQAAVQVKVETIAPPAAPAIAPAEKPAEAVRPANVDLRWSKWDAQFQAMERPPEPARVWDWRRHRPPSIDGTLGGVSEAAI